VIAMAAGHAPQAAVVKAAGGRAVTHDFVLTTSGGLSGTVLSNGNSPLPGATVTLSEAAGGVLAEDTTGPDGKFVLPGHFEGTCLLTATAPGYRPASQEVELDETAGTALLALVAEAEVHGVVSGPHDAPVPGVTVSLANAGGDVVASVVTGEDGSYRLSGLDGGEHVLVAGGYHPVSAVVRVEEGQTASVTVHLGPG
jgi:hypothetical protein